LPVPGQLTTAAETIPVIPVTQSMTLATTWGAEYSPRSRARIIASWNSASSKAARFTWVVRSRS
jgi:hypothetical protein